MFSVVLVTAIILVETFPSLRLRGKSVDIPSLASMGFGKVQPYAFLNINLPQHDPTGLIANVLFANSPHFVLSSAYIFYNAMIRTFLMQRELSYMHNEGRRKTLRVSEPIDIQRGSYLISLPLRYGLPLYASSAFMHWMISQAFFLARITAMEADGSIDPMNSFSTCGYSQIAVFICKSLEASLCPTKKEM